MRWMEFVPPYNQLPTVSAVPCILPFFSERQRKRYALSNSNTTDPVVWCAPVQGYTPRTTNSLAISSSSLMRRAPAKTKTNRPTPSTLPPSLLTDFSHRSNIHPAKRAELDHIEQEDHQPTDIRCIVTSSDDCWHREPTNRSAREML